ncbi:MAG: Hsp20/alpha crystallin family protein [Methanomassiliicoccales archaeon]|nr:MAG: Hsp20/alpha crystallin family protein [Methanomassiliicoccales archaeon]
MTKKKRKRNFDDDDHWPERDPFFDDFFEFGDIDREFERMREYMDRITKRAARGELGQKEQGPYVYGFSMRVGPDGKPNIQEFGNTRPSRRLERGADEQFEIAEREPMTDVIESKDSISITLEIPGVGKDEIELTVEEDKVSINVDTPERRYFKEIPLKIKVDPKTSKATYKNGVLDIILKKVPTKEKKGKKVKIQ